MIPIVRRFLGIHAMIISQCLQFISGGPGLAGGLFLAGLAGGFTHCAGMCSPFVLAQIGPDTRILRPSVYLMIPYHLGRMTTYVFLAALLHSAVNLAFLFSPQRIFIVAPLLTIAAVLFLISALPTLSGFFPWAQRLRLPLPVSRILGVAGGFMKNQDAISRYVLGVLLGFMPCGLVLSALLVSSAAQTTGSAMIAMGAFALGTVPALVLVAIGGRALLRKHPHMLTRLSHFAMALSAVWLFWVAGRLV